MPQECCSISIDDEGIPHCKNVPMSIIVADLCQLICIANLCCVSILFDSYHQLGLGLRLGIQQDVRIILMYEHLRFSQYILHDIEAGYKVILRDHCRYKRYIMQNGDTYYKKFPWKQTLIE